MEPTARLDCRDMNAATDAALQRQTRLDAMVRKNAQRSAAMPTRYRVDKPYLEREDSAPSTHWSCRDLTMLPVVLAEHYTSLLTENQALTKRIAQLEDVCARASRLCGAHNADAPLLRQT